MAAMRFFGFLARVALAGLPIAAAAVFVTFFARDISETASAVLAVAALLSTASLIQIATLIRDTRRIATLQDETRMQALALARCMKVLNQRMATLEQDPASRMETISLPVRPTVAFMADIAPELPPMPQPAAEPEPAPLPVPGPAEGQSGPLPILTLPQRKLWGLEITGAAGLQEPHFLARRTAQSADDALIAKIRTAIEMLDEPGPAGAQPRLLVVTPVALSATPRALDLAATRIVADERFRKRFLLGVPQAIIRSGGATEAMALARLAKAGLAFALVDVADFRIDAEALAACSISHVRIDARRLITAGEDGLTAATTAVSDLARRLKSGGITLMCSGVDDEKLTPDLNELQVELAQGPALALPRNSSNVVPMPWRAAAEAPPPRVVRAGPFHALLTATR